MAEPPRVSRQTYTSRDTILYALGIGAGARAAAEVRALKFVYEEGLQALPLMAVVLAHPGFWAREPKYGLNWRKLLHAHQSLKIEAPIPVQGTIRGELVFEEVWDKGVDRGAMVCTRRDIYDDATGQLLACARNGMMFRADGGSGGRTDSAPRPPAMPERRADWIREYPVRPEQAMLYRLSGDFNPLHIDPEVARSAGFERPILHGLATYGYAGLAAVEYLCEWEAARLREFNARFTSPVFPDETLRVRVWRLNEREAVFRVEVVERNIVVLDNGYASIDDG
jgi:acyl dehydratase